MGLIIFILEVCDVIFIHVQNRDYIVKLYLTLFYYLSIPNLGDEFCNILWEDSINISLQTRQIPEDTKDNCLSDSDKIYILQNSIQVEFILF